MAGQEEGSRARRVSTQVADRVIVQQKPTRHCQAVTFQLKKKKGKEFCGEMIVTAANSVNVLKASERCT